MGGCLATSRTSSRSESSRTCVQPFALIEIEVLMQSGRGAGGRPVWRCQGRWPRYEVLRAGVERSDQVIEASKYN